MCQPRTFCHETALTLWRRGLPTTAIAENVNSNPVAIHAVIKRARAHGDTRAVRRYLIDGVKKYPERARWA